MDYRNPTPTVDIIIELSNDHIVLIERKNAPLGFALPGGFVDEGESVEHAAIREAKEETGLDVTLRTLLYVYSRPDRDARQHTMSTVFIATSEGTPQAMDDADAVHMLALDALPETICFDHAEILEDYIHFKATGQSPSPLDKYTRHG